MHVRCSLLLLHVGLKCRRCSEGDCGHRRERGIGRRACVKSSGSRHAYVASRSHNSPRPVTINRQMRLNKRETQAAALNSHDYSFIFSFAHLVHFFKMRFMNGGTHIDTCMNLSLIFSSRESVNRSPLPFHAPLTTKPLSTKPTSRFAHSILHTARPINHPREASPRPCLQSPNLLPVLYKHVDIF